MSKSRWENTQWLRVCSISLPTSHSVIMFKHSSAYHREVHYVFIIEDHISCKACIKTFRHIKHLQRHAWDKPDRDHQNYYLLTLSYTDCKHCNTPFINKCSLTVHNRHFCTREEFIVMLQSELNTEGKSINISQQLLPSDLSKISSDTFTSFNLKTINHSNKSSHNRWYSEASLPQSQKKWKKL